MIVNVVRFKSHAQKLLMVSLLIALLLNLFLPTLALAWKPTMHVWMADVALQDALDDGKVTIYRVNYEAGEILEPVGEYEVDPDILTGQQVIHPGEDDTGVVGGSQAWFQHVWDRSKDPGYNTPSVKAFTVGYLTHAGGDMFGHTFVNNFSGGSFAINPPQGPANAIKHLVVEGYVDKRLDTSRMNAAFFDASISGVEDFIYKNMIDARPGTTLDSELLRPDGGGTEFSIPRIFSTLRANLAKEIKAYNDKVAELKRRLAACSRFDVICKTRRAAELGAYVTANELQTEYKRAWRDDIDSGLRAWPQVSHQVAVALFFNAERKTDVAKAEAILDKYVIDHLLSMAGAPDFVGLTIGIINSIIDAITPDFLEAAIQQLKDELLNTLLKAAIGMTKDELETYLTSPEHHFDLVMNGGAGENVTLQRFNTDYLHLKDTGYANPNESFDYRKVRAAYNTVTMSKLIFLNKDGLNQVLRDLGGKELGNADKENVMLGFIPTLDGGNQWSNGMVFARDCQVYKQIFMRQAGENPLAACGGGHHTLYLPLVVK